MAIFESTIFENLSGTVGNVTSYKLKDKQVARAKIFSRKDAKTLQQLKQRTRRILHLFKKGCIQPFFGSKHGES